MDIKSTLVSLAPALPGPSSKANLPLKLQLGQLVSAKVVASLKTDQLLLEINGRQVLADSRVSAKPGQTLTLEVLQTGPTPQLKALSTGNPSQVIVQQATRTLLPRQAPLHQALNEINFLFQQAQSQSALPPFIRLPLATLLKAIPKQEQLIKPQSLKTQILKSGLFHEAEKSQPATSTPKNDLKANLLNLAAALKGASQPTESTPKPQTPPRFNLAQADTSFSQIKILPHQQTTLTAKLTPTSGKKQQSQPAPLNETDTPLLQLEKKTASALARLALDQLASLPKNESAQPTWHFEIPYFQGETLETLRLTISQESSQEKSGQPREAPWSVTLELEPENLGKIRVKILIQGEKINSFFWSERQTTRQLFEKHFDVLKHQLQKAGLDPETLQTAKTIDDPQPAAPSNQHLINVTT